MGVEAPLAPVTASMWLSSSGGGVTPALTPNQRDSSSKKRSRLNGEVSWALKRVLAVLDSSAIHSDR